MSKFRPKIKIPIAIQASVLTSMTMLWTGIMAFYDFPQIFESQLISEFGITPLQNSLLYTATSVISILSSLIGGIMVSKMPLGRSAIIYTFLAYIGSLLCYTAIPAQDYRLLFVGRLIFGIGEELSFVVQISIAEKWFSGGILSIAISLNRLFVFFGQSTASFFMPKILLESRDLGYVLFVYNLVVFTCVVSGVLYWYLELRYGHLLSKEPKVSGSCVPELGDEEMSDYMDYKAGFGDLFRLSGFAKSYILLIAICSSFYYQFTNIATDLLVHRYNLSFAESTQTLAILPLTAVIVISIFSVVLTKTGKRGLVLALSFLLGAITFLWMTFIPENGGNLVLPMVGIGVFFGGYSSTLSSSLTILLPRQAVSLVFGVVLSSASVGYSAFPIVFGILSRVRDAKSYQNCLIVLSLYGFFCTGMSGVLAFWDYRGNRLMHYPENDQRVLRMREDMSRRLALGGETNGDREEGEFETLRG